MKKLLFLVSEDHYFYSHRLNLAKAALKAGYQVALATRCFEYCLMIHDAGIEVLPLKFFNRSGVNPWKQLKSLIEIYRIYKNYQPDIVHHVALKPVVFGSLVAAWLKVPKVINALGGLGYLFTDPNSDSLQKKTLRFILCLFFRFLLNKPNTMLILQNKDDQALLEKNCHLSPKKSVLIRGAGVDINRFNVCPFPPEPPIIIACVARMLRDKGIHEVIDAAKNLQDMNLPVKVILYGTPDLENPSSITLERLQAWHHEKIITWEGHSTDIPKAYANCHIAVLPSYREGLPKSLLEAASIGRPIVTTNAPGCKEVVTEGVNGLLVPIQDSKALTQALVTLINNPNLRIEMGHNSRKRAETEFADTMIHEQTLALYSAIS